MMRTKEAWEELVTYCPAAKKSEVTVQHRSGLSGLVMEEDGRHTPPSIPAAQGWQQRPWGCTELPGARDHEEGCHLPGGGSHIGGKVVHTTQPPRALIGGQPTKVQSKMTLRPKAATPVNRSRSLTQVGPLSQFSGLQLRNRDGEGPWEKDAAAPQQTDMGTTLAPPKGTSGTEMVNPHRQVGPPEEWRLPDTGST